MINLIYILIFFILIFVIVVAFRAVTSGLKQKKNLKDNEFKKEPNKDILENIERLKKLRDDGTLNEEEFIKEKKKILEEN